MRITFNGQPEMDASAIKYNPSIFFENAYRQSLEVHFDPAKTDLNTINALVSDPAKTAHIITADIEQGVFDDYSRKVLVAQKQVEIGKDPATQVPIMEERIVAELARLTAIEIQLQKLGITV